jgi:hypothetical protein
MSSLHYMYWNACGLLHKLPEVSAFLSPPPPLFPLPPSSNRFACLHMQDEPAEGPSGRGDAAGTSAEHSPRCTSPSPPPLPPIDVLGFVECRLATDTPLPPQRNYSWLLFPQGGRSGGLAFLVRSSLSSQPRLDLSYNVDGAGVPVDPSFSPEEAVCLPRVSAVVWLEVRLPNQLSALYGLVYLHPNAERRDWEGVAASIRKASDTERPLFVLGDFNSHSDEWGDARAGGSHFADSLLELCDVDLSLDILNRSLAYGQVTRPDRRQGSTGAGTIIDLALTSHPECVRAFQVCTDTGMHSDHFPLSAVVSPPADVEAAAEAQAATAHTARPQWDTARAQWTAFAELASMYLSSPSAVSAFDALSACARCSEVADGAAGPWRPAECGCSNPEGLLESAWGEWKLAVLDAAHLALRIKLPCSYSKSWWNYPHADLPAAYRAFRCAARLQVKYPNRLEVRKALAERRREWRRLVALAKQWLSDSTCQAIQRDPCQTLRWRAWRAWKGHCNDAADPASSPLHSIRSPLSDELPSSPQQALQHLAAHFAHTMSLPALEPLPEPLPAAQVAADQLADIQLLAEAAAEPDVMAMDWRNDGKTSEDDRREAAAEALGQGPPAPPPSPPPAAAAAAVPPPPPRPLAAVEQWVEQNARRVGDTPCCPKLEVPYAWEDLEAVVANLRPSAPGADHIPAVLLQHGGVSLRERLLVLYNYSWTHGSLPLDWRSADVVALFKGKGDRSLPTNYRPISLTSIVVRTLERLIHRRLYAFAEEKHLLHSRQFGFRTGHSTLDAVYVLTERIKRLLAAPRGRAVPVAFLDLTKAYDRTWHAGLLKRLASVGVTGRVWDWIRAFLQSRRFRIISCTADGNSVCSDWWPIDAGVPQGAVLSPLLFAIFIDPLAALFEGAAFRLPRQPPSLRQPACTYPCIELQLFADDIALSPDTTLIGWQHCFQLALEKLEEFAAEWRLTFSLDAGKSAIVYFRRLGAALDVRRFPPHFLLNGRALAVVPQYVYLGVVLDQTLRWEPHVERLLKKANGAVNAIVRAIPKFAPSKLRAMHVPLLHATAAAIKQPTLGGPHFSAIRTLVVGCLLPLCTYGLQFVSGLGVAKRLAALQSVLVRPLRRVLSLPPSTHVLSILVECELATLPLFRYQLLAAYASRVGKLPLGHPARVQLVRSQAEYEADMADRTAAAAGAVAARVVGAGPLLAELPLAAAPCSRFDWAAHRQPLLVDVVHAQQQLGVHVLKALQQANSQLQPLPAVVLASQPVFMHCNGGQADADARQPLAPLSLPAQPPLSSGSAAPLPVSPPSPSSRPPSTSRPQPVYFPPDGVIESAEEPVAAVARRVTYAQWQQQIAGRTLQQYKHESGRSWYLYLEPRCNAVLRARIRLQRTSLAAYLYRQGRLHSPLCSHPSCRAHGIEETVEHMLLDCPLLLAARQRCARQLYSICHMDLSLSLLFGDVRPPSSVAGHKPHQPASSLSCPHIPDACRPAVRGPLQQPVRPSLAAAAAAGPPLQRPVLGPRRSPRSAITSTAHTPHMPPPSLPVPPSSSAGRAAALRRLRAALFITAGLLRSLRSLKGGVL